LRRRQNLRACQSCGRSRTVILHSIGLRLRGAHVFRPNRPTSKGEAQGSQHSEARPHSLFNAAEVIG
jgi:hypothetical protein